MINYIITAILILFGAYIFFIFAPTFTSFFTVFTRKTGTLFTKMDMKKSYFAPFFDQMSSAYDRLMKIGSDEVFIEARDNTRLCAEYFDRGSDKTAILIHGYNTTPLNNYNVIACDFFDNGYNILMPYNRAHEKSGGKRCTLGITEQYDVLSWIEYAEKNLLSKEIIIYGTSMGCAAVSYASDKITNEKVKCLILDCGFDSPYAQIKHDMDERFLPSLLMMPIMRLMAKIILKLDIKTSVRDSLKKCKKPALFIHGTADSTVPVSAGKKNYESCNSVKESIFVNGADHTMSYLVGGDKTREALFGFIRKFN